MGKTSLYYIFFTFLKLGATAFGGYMSLVAIVQKQLVEIDKKLKEEDILDGISLTSVLPGPVAVNTVAYIGYRLRGISGSIMAFLGIILPSFVLVILLSWLYFTYGNVPAVKNVFNGIMPAVTALIVTVAIGMSRKTIKSISQWIICAVAAILLVVVGGFAITLITIILSGVVGSFLYKQPLSSEQNCSKGTAINKKQWLISGSVLLLLLCLLLWGGQSQDAPKNLRVLYTFSGISLTLFGGGYVVIPALHELFVDNLQWLTSSEFADGIAIGQITPGPIFITATFIGYKVAGVLGASLATVGIFTPPAVLTVLLSRFVEALKQSAVVKAIMKGIRAAVIGMIFASAVTIGQTMVISVVSILIFVITFVISLKYVINPIYLILGSGLVGFVLF